MKRNIITKTVCLCCVLPQHSRLRTAASITQLLAVHYTLETQPILLRRRRRWYFTQLPNQLAKKYGKNSVDSRTVWDIRHILCN